MLFKTRNHINIVVWLILIKFLLRKIKIFFFNDGVMAFQIIFEYIFLHLKEKIYINTNIHIDLYCIYESMCYILNSENTS